MNTLSRHIPSIIEQYAEEAAFLWLLRDAAVARPDYLLSELAELEDRVEAQIDGARIAGEAGWSACESALSTQESGEGFVAGVLAWESGDKNRLGAVAQAAADSEDILRGFAAASGWVAFKRVGPWLPGFLSSKSAIWRRLGIGTYAVHRQDPGTALATCLQDDDPMVRARALRAAGELKRVDLLDQVKAAYEAEEPECRFWAAWSGVLLGSRSAVPYLENFVSFKTPFCGRALPMLCRVLQPAAAREWLKALASDAERRREVIVCMGVSGDPGYVPTLLAQLEEPEFARVAGEALNMITGLDLEEDELEGEWPEGFTAGPSEDPADEDVELDPDEDLAWPEPAKVHAWWASNQNRFERGRRYLLGRPIDEAHCRQVLCTGLQRQRYAAALELALMDPQAPLFETRAPARRQQRLLGLR